MISWKMIEIGTFIPVDKDVLVYCPDEKPNIVSAKFIQTDEYSGRWAYSDELLSDAHPEGPDPTHWAFAFTPEDQS